MSHPLPDAPLESKSGPLLPTSRSRRFGEMIPGSLPVVVRSYKAAVARMLARERLRIWQRGYHESILRGTEALTRARVYIDRHPPIRA
jgi:hypothetical protein